MPNSTQWLAGTQQAAQDTTPRYPFGLDTDGALSVDNEVIAPGRRVVKTFNLCLNASLGTQPFWIADRAYTVLAIYYNAKTQATGTLTCKVTKDGAGVAPGAGVSLQTGTFNCVTIANETVTAGVLTAVAADLNIAAGDQLSVKFTGSVTTLAGVAITVVLSPAGKSTTVEYYCHANGDIATQTFMIANRPMVVTGVKVRYGTAFAGAVTIDVTKDTGTTACGGGTSVLAAAAAGDGTINTTLSPALAASAATLALAPGDRLAVKFSATTTGADVVVAVSFQPLYGESHARWQLAVNAQQQVAQTFFIADRPYELVDGACVADVTAGGAAKLAITIDRGTTAAGGGTSVDTTNSSAGFDLAATARTVQWIAPNIRSNRILGTGDKLGLKVSGGAGNIVKTCVVAALRPL